MAAQRKKGKNSQKPKTNKPAGEKPAAKPTSDNAAGSKPTPHVETPAVAEVSTASDFAVAEPVPAPAESSESSELSESSAPSQPSQSSATTPETQDAVPEPSPAPSAAPSVEPTAAGSATPSSPVETETATAKSQTSTATATVDSPTATLTEKTAQPAAAPTIVKTDERGEFGKENFGKDEIRTLLVPVKPFHRLIACVIVLLCYSWLGFIILKGVPTVNAHGLHEIDLPEPGAYVLFFRGDLIDAYGWAKDGRFRNSLEIDMEPIEPFQKVTKVEPFKDISGANFFTVAEFEINQPGKYNLWIKWNKPQDRCKGKIYLEKDPVEKFFFKWALGIIGTIALFFMIGVPMTTQKAQSTLPQKPPQT